MPRPKLLDAFTGVSPYLFLMHHVMPDLMPHRKPKPLSPPVILIFLEETMMPLIYYKIS